MPSNDDRGEDLDEIVSYGELKPIRRPPRRPLAISKPPVPPNRMTAEEIDAWAGELVGEMAAAMGRSGSTGS